MPVMVTTSPMLQLLDIAHTHRRVALAVTCLRSSNVGAVNILVWLYRDELAALLYI